MVTQRNKSESRAVHGVIIVVKTLKKYRVAFGLKTLVMNHCQNPDHDVGCVVSFGWSNADQLAVRDLYQIRSKYIHHSTLSVDIRSILLLIR